VEPVLLLAARIFYSQCHGNKEDHRMEMRWCLVALKPLCRSLLFGVCVVVVGHKMIKWQRSCQGRCTWQKFHRAMVKGCVAVKISSVVLVF
jgi:hypothetical protein